jgi:hypothetical protein
LIADHVRYIVAALHYHHAVEDEMLWPKLPARPPAGYATSRRSVRMAEQRGNRRILAWPSAAVRSCCPTVVGMPQQCGIPEPAAGHVGHDRIQHVLTELAHSTRHISSLRVWRDEPVWCRRPAVRNDR